MRLLGPRCPQLKGPPKFVECESISPTQGAESINSIRLEPGWGLAPWCPHPFPISHSLSLSSPCLRIQAKPHVS